MSVLSIHIDESGNLNLTNKQNPEYCIAMVFHNQDDDISSGITFLDEKLSKIGWSAPFVHTMPLIRQDKPFETMEGTDRKRIFNTFASFVSALPISYAVFFADKSFYEDADRMQEAYEHQIRNFIENNLEIFHGYDSIICYYDRGQAIVSRILQNTLGSIFGNRIEFRTAYQKDYKLLQVADYICTLEQTKMRWDENRATKSEKCFFGTRHLFMKNYYRKIVKKHI